MDIGLTPREIQTRIRAGASLDEVAEAAGVPTERIEGFASPVLAEREHIAAIALAGSVRRRSDNAAHRTLNVAVTDRLAGRGVSADNIAWDAWRREDRKWTLIARYELGATPREAIFHYHQQSRVCVPANDDARWLTGELAALPGAPDDPTEPTIDLNDELALVRALREPAGSDPASFPDDAEVPPLTMLHRAEGYDEAAEPTHRIDLGPIEGSGEVGPIGVGDQVPLPRSQATPQDIGQEIEAQLANYDSGVEPGGIDLLYDFLDRPDERNEYAGLAADPEQPVLDFDESAGGRPNLVAATDPDETPATNTDTPVAKQRRRRRKKPLVEEPDSSAEQDQSPRPSPTAATAAEDHAAHIAKRPEAPDTDTKIDTAATNRTNRAGGKESPPPPVTSSGSGSASESAEDTVQMARPKKRRGRAAVPSWDEIMFGGPGTNED